jgi:hypothetical protein
MSKKGVLGYVEADGYCSGIAFANFEVDVGYR